MLWSQTGTGKRVVAREHSGARLAGLCPSGRTPRGARGGGPDWVPEQGGGGLGLAVRGWARQRGSPGGRCQAAARRRSSQPREQRAGLRDAARAGGCDYAGGAEAASGRGGAAGSDGGLGCERRLQGALPEYGHGRWARARRRCGWQSTAKRASRGRGSRWPATGGRGRSPERRSECGSGTGAWAKARTRSW
nr:uncharacterized protein LOC109783864 [Aegilops tauschii subsp. strangulata]